MPALMFTARHAPRAATCATIALRAVLGLTVLGCRHETPRAEAASTVPSGEVQFAKDSPKLAALTIEPARVSTRRVLATLPAEVVPDEDHTVRVAAPVGGRVISVDVRPGDRVTAGQALVHILSADAAQATSDMSKAAAALGVARAALARTTDLYNHKISSARELEQARADDTQARAEFDRARARSAQLGAVGESVSSVFILRAPIGGVVIDRAINAGAEVRADNPATLVTISSLAHVWLVVSVPQRDLALVHRGTEVQFTSESAPGRSFAGAISFVSDALDPSTHLATARAVVSNPDTLLRLLVTGEAQLVDTNATPSLEVPSRALVTHGDGPVLFIETAPGRFVRRAVVVTDDDGTTATIGSGLAPGERVVTGGTLLLAGEADRGS